MAKGDPLTAQVEVDFLGDERLEGLTSATKLAYIAWWLTAVKHRREYLPMRLGSPSSVARRCYLEQRSCKNAAEMLVERGLLNIVELNGEKFIRVCGVRKKHSFFRSWHDEKEFRNLTIDLPARLRTGRDETGRDETGRDATDQASRFSIEEPGAKERIAAIIDRVTRGGRNGKERHDAQA